MSVAAPALIFSNIRLQTDQLGLFTSNMSNNDPQTTNFIKCTAFSSCFHAHIYDTLGMHILGQFRTTEYVIRCVESVCSAELWVETQDYKLVSLSWWDYGSVRRS